MDFKDFSDQVVYWHTQTFPDATPFDMLEKLDEECLELTVELEEEQPNMERVAEEMADVFLVLTALAGRLGVNLMVEAERKFEINKGRTWE